MAVTLELFVSDIESALGSFNVFRVERSTAGEAGPYLEITGPAKAAATLLGSETGVFTLSGKTLNLIVDNQPELAISFTGIDPLTTDQVADQVDAAVGQDIAAEESNRLRLTSTLLGTTSKLEVVGGSAASVLGFTAGDRDIGEEAYVSLVSGESSYPFVDDDGVAGYLYKTWLYHTGTGQESKRSAPFEGAPGTKVPGADLSLCSVDLVDAAGVAHQGQKITFFPLHRPMVVGGFSVAIGRKPITIETDNAGHAEISLVRGLRCRVVFEGTSLIRDIVIPDTASCDLLGVIGASPDIFDVAAPVLPTAPRRTL